MNACRRTILTLSGWAVLLASSSAQLQLKREPLPAPEPAVPAPAPGAKGRLIDRLFNGNVIINGGNVIINGGDLIIAGEPGAEPVNPSADPTGPQLLEYGDGQRLHGTLTAFDSERGEFLWQRPDASAAMSVPVAEISRWSAEESASPATGPATTVKFSGSDWLVADVTAIDADKVRLQLRDGTRVTTNRSQVEWIYFSKNSAAATYDGPTSLDGWNAAGNWIYRDGALRASAPAPISRNFPSLPDQVEYRMFVNQGDGMRAFTLSLHSRNAAARGVSRGMIQLMLRETTLNLWASIDGNFRSVQVNLAPLQDNPLRTKGPILFRVYEDFTNGRLLVYINDSKVADWGIDKGVPGKNGGNFQFQPTVWDGQSEQSISMIRIMPWNGLEPGPGDERTDDRVTLGTGEVKQGKFTSWDGRLLKMTTERGTVAVQSGEIGLLQFRRPENPPDDEPTVAHLRLAGRGEFDVVALQWRDGKFQARTNFGGDLLLPPAAIASLAFNRPPAKARSGEDMLVFRNGDRLRGSLESGDEKGKLRWRPNPAGPAIEFSPTFLRGLQFAPRTPNAARPPGGVAACFRNGDWLAGKLVTLDREQLVLETAEVGQLVAARPGLQSLLFDARGLPGLSDGVSDHAIWERGLDTNVGTSEQRKKLLEAGSPWSYFAGAFSRTSTSANDSAFNRVGGIQLGRLFETMPPRVEFSFTFTAERQPYFSMQLFTEPGNLGYMLHLSGGILSFYDMNPRPRGRGITPQQFPFGKEINVMARERRLRILADRTTGRFIVFVDGVLTAQVHPKNPEGSRNLGRGVMITPQPSMAATISDLWVGPWNGVIPGKNPAPQPAVETVVLANGDEVQGTVGVATPSTMKIESDVGPLELAVERLTMVDFGGQSMTRRPGTRLHLAGQGALTVTDWRVENEMVICRSAAVGELKVPLKVIQEIVFAAPGAGGGTE